MKNPEKFDQFDYTIQQGCPDILKDAWFAVNHNYRLVAVGGSREEATNWMEVQSLLIEDSRALAVEHYEHELLRVPAMTDS